MDPRLSKLFVISTVVIGAIGFSYYYQVLKIETRKRKRIDSIMELRQQVMEMQWYKDAQPTEKLEVQSYFRSMLDLSERP